jgi:hypothetical protein
VAITFDDHFGRLLISLRDIETNKRLFKISQRFWRSPKSPSLARVFRYRLCI